MGTAQTFLRGTWATRPATAARKTRVAVAGAIMLRTISQRRGYFALAPGLGVVNGERRPTSGPKIWEHTMSFYTDLYQACLELIRAMRPILERLREHDGRLATQLKDATNSIASNASEGARRLGRDKQHLWSVASGSANEVRTQLDAALAWGDLDADIVAPALKPLDRILAMLWRGTHPLPGRPLPQPQRRPRLTASTRTSA